MSVRKGMSLLLALALMIVVFSAACPLSAKADGDAPYGVMFAYNNQKYVLTGGSSVRLSNILSAFGLSGTVSSMGGSVVNSEGEVDLFAIYDVLDFTYDSEKDDWMVTAIGFLDSSNSCTMYVTISGTQYTFTLTWLDGRISGIPPANGGYVYVNGIKWRVIGVSSDKWLLISANVVNGNLTHSNALANCTTMFNGFTSPEKAAVLNTTKTDIPYDVFYAVDLNNANLFLLSITETLTYFNSDGDRKPGGWWLRSLFQNANYYVGVIDEDDGSVTYYGAFNSGFGVRPAFVLNRSSVLFESAAANGKPAVNSGFGTYAEPAASTDRKLTLIDGARSDFDAEADGSAVIAGGTLTVNYSGAVTGENEYVSAMLCDSGGYALYYASVTSEGNGAWDLTIPADLAEGSYTLKVFSEQRNGDNLSDYASGFVSIPLTATRFSGSGTAADPWQIGSAADWNKLASTVGSGAATDGQYFRLTDNIVVSTMIGTAGNPFGGHFDGAGHTLTIDYTATETFCAPFRYVDGAAIEKLTVTGTITTDYISAAGFVGNAASCTITNCVSNVNIISDVTSASEHGGFVATAANTRIEGCVYTGSITGNNPRYCAGFLNRGDNNCLCVNCIFAPNSFPTNNCANFCRWGNAGDNCYYFTFLGSGRDTGKQAISVTADEGLTIDFGEPTATYSVSGITAYPTGLKYGGVFYAGTGESVTIGLPAELTDGFDATLTASAGTLTKTGEVWTLTMPDEDVAISAEFTMTFGPAAFTLPAALTTIEANAFEGDTFITAVDAHNCTSIGAEAFQGCTGLTQIRVHPDCQINDTAFTGCGTVYVFAPAGSAAETSCADIVNCVFVPEAQN